MTADVVLLLRAAIDSLEKGDLAGAAWRVADAGGLLRERIDAFDRETWAIVGGLLRVRAEFQEVCHRIGVDSPTGRGMMLPRRGE